MGTSCHWFASLSRFRTWLDGPAPDPVRNLSSSLRPAGHVFVLKSRRPLGPVGPKLVRILYTPSASIIQGPLPQR